VLGSIHKGYFITSKLLLTLISSYM